MDLSLNEITIFQIREKNAQCIKRRRSVWINRYKRYQASKEWINHTSSAVLR